MHIYKHMVTVSVSYFQLHHCLSGFTYQCGVLGKEILTGNLWLTAVDLFTSDCHILLKIYEVLKLQ